jgi:hypothetical protein
MTSASDMPDPPDDKDHAGSHQASPIEIYYRSLHSSCEAILRQSLEEARSGVHSEGHTFTADFDLWLKAIGPRKECVLIDQAAREYQYALLSLVQGLYRQAFTALRLSLELTLAAIFYSAHELLLIEWVENRRDINWRRITSKKGGVFTDRFARAFAPDLVTEAAHFSSIASKLYRECSEFVHGNPLATSAIPRQLQFNSELFDRWHEKAASARAVITFFLFLRYFGDLTPSARVLLEVTVRDHIGHIAQARKVFDSDTVTA